MRRMSLWCVMAQRVTHGSKWGQEKCLRRKSNFRLLISPVEKLVALCLSLFLSAFNGVRKWHRV